MSEHAQEIIIIKRHGDHEDGHHGGAWKIALADFMTAMMALFLVMWLINSTSKEQKQTIAEYFNPVKLAEVTHDRKGVNDPQDTPNDPAPSGKGKGDGGSAEGKGDAAGAPGSRARESALFQDPYAVLAKLAGEAETGPEAASADASALDAGQPGVAGGETGRDPFDPLYWQVANLPRQRTDNPGTLDTVAAAPAEARLDARAPVGAPVKKEPPKEIGKENAKEVARQSLHEAMRKAGVKLASAEPMPLDAAKPIGLAKPAAEAGPEAPAPEVKVPETKVPDAKPAQPEPQRVAKAEAPPVKEPPAAADQAAKAAETAALSALKAEIARAVPSLPNTAPAPNVEVRRTGEGVLISITDEINFSMFGVGSAEPTPKVVKALERIAKILNSRPGRIVVRGHTDGRPFRSETYDNWRLSSARAQMASYMLVRGGLDEARIERIEGYADRQPRIAADPKAAENRRIEILLRGLPE
ncbi:MotB family protein [Methylorubrum sp. B1-46]|jgi:chemotaxis protein MotB|uniref:MotB family protein n=1 Tax=Methylorubrum sp. B1-46 TaxID=2897334 RepID=UPI001E51E609|nr:MotB family protein [Methylorubrum sp. B1-46]UGB26649.1 MotB family protein [Methylorubrum sp. B1-46]